MNQSVNNCFRCLLFFRNVRGSLVLSVCNLYRKTCSWAHFLSKRNRQSLKSKPRYVLPNYRKIARTDNTLNLKGRSCLQAVIFWTRTRSEISYKRDKSQKGVKIPGAYTVGTILCPVVSISKSLFVKSFLKSLDRHAKDQCQFPPSSRHVVKKKIRRRNRI